MDVRLSGYRYSVYTRAARMALARAGVRYDYDEVNPFDPEGPEQVHIENVANQSPVTRSANG